MIGTERDLPYKRFIVVRVEIELEQKYEGWYVTVCQAYFGAGLARRFPAPSRRFTSHEAALNFCRRLVLRHLREEGRVETGSDLHCHVKMTR
jgi:hypothetical protein